MSEVLSRVVLSPDFSIPGQVAEHMSGRPKDIVVFELFPEDLGKAVGEATVFPGVTVEDVDSYIENKPRGDNRLHVSGAINAFGKQTEFSGIIANTPSGISVVDSSHQIGRFSAVNVMLLPVINKTDELARKTMNLRFGGATVRQLHVGTESLEATIAGRHVTR